MSTLMVRSTEPYMRIGYVSVAKYPLDLRDTRKVLTDV
jgi:hypothetical protein